MKIIEVFLDIVHSIVEIENTKKFNNVIKKSLWFTPLVYIISTLSLLYRNRIHNLPFVSISLVQATLIFIYFMFFICYYYLLRYTLKQIMDCMKGDGRNKKLQLLFLLLVMLLYYLLMFFILYILIGNIWFSFTTVFGYYLVILFLPFIIKGGDENISELLTILLFISIILKIPLSLGGFMGEKVVYHEYLSSKEESYVYYGVYEGLYQFEKDNTIVLVPIDSGYIKYKIKEN